MLCSWPLLGWIRLDSGFLAASRLNSVAASGLDFGLSGGFWCRFWLSGGFWAGFYAPGGSLAVLCPSGGFWAGFSASGLGSGFLAASGVAEGHSF